MDLPTSASDVSIFRVESGIVGKMAALTSNPQILKGTVRRVVIQVRDVENHLRAGDLMGLIIHGPTIRIGRRSLAATLGAFQDGRPDVSEPIRRIGFIVDGHLFFRTAEETRDENPDGRNGEDGDGTQTKELNVG